MIHHRILTIALAALVLVLTASPALAAKAPHRYSPRHGAKCRKTYRRVKHGRRAYCVKRAAPKKKATPLTAAAAPTSPASTEKTKLKAHLDPSFTRNPLNPFEITYAYSASASQQSFSAQSLALGAEEPAPLPSGVLSLFSDGKLECAINVGSDVEGSECPVNYQALGAHTVTTIYTSGEQSATETEVEQIEPLPTSTTLSVGYADLPGGPSLTEGYVHCTHPSLERETCTYEYEWELGTLTEAASSDPAGSVSVRCTVTSCPALLTGTIDGTIQAPVMLRANGKVTGDSGQVTTGPTCEQVKEAAHAGGDPFYRWSYPTEVALSAAPISQGYMGSSAVASLEFSPTLPC